MLWNNFIKIIIFNVLVSATLLLGQQNSLTLRHDNFLIHYKIPDEKFAIKLSSSLEEHLHYFSKFFEVEPNFGANIIIVSTPAEFRALFSGRLPEWTGAFYVSSKNTIILKSLRWSQPQPNIEKDFLHELSHLFFETKFGSKKIPLWYNEGLAEFLSGSRIGIQKGKILSNAILAKTLMPLAEIDSLTYFSHRMAELAYIQSLSAVLMLKSNLGSLENWQKFHQELLTGEWSNSFKKYFGMDEIDFEIAWYKAVEKKYQWFFVLNLENLIWVFIIGILASTMFYLRFRNRKKLKEWDLEEDEMNSTSVSYMPNNLNTLNDDSKKG
jgi:hypothetical protein